MSCNQPLQAWQSHVLRTVNDKPVIAFKREHVSHLPYQEIALPCGKCLDCLFDRAKAWSVRCVHEASQWDANAFITLTFNEKWLSADGGLDKADFQLFMKRLRKHEEGVQAVRKIDGHIYEEGEYPNPFRRRTPPDPLFPLR